MVPHCERKYCIFKNNLKTEDIFKMQARWHLYNIGGFMNQNLWKKLCGIVKEEYVKTEEPMKDHTTFRIGGPADYFVMPHTVDEVRQLVELCSCLLYTSKKAEQRLKKILCLEKTEDIVSQEKNRFSF